MEAAPQAENENGIIISEEVAAAPPPHVVLIPGIFVGHFMPMAELAKTVRLHHGLPVIFVAPDCATTADQLQQSANELRAAGVTFLQLPVLEKPTQQENPASFPETVTALYERTKPLLEQALAGILATTPVSALVMDFFCADLMEVPHRLGLPIYGFYPGSASDLCLHMYTRAQRIPGADPDRLLHVPGLPEMSVGELPHWHKDEEMLQWSNGITHKFMPALGLLINTFEAAEEQALAVLRTGILKTETKEFYAVGPITREPKVRGTKNECLEWLNQQPPQSVVYVCFGSIFTVPGEQIREIALGLEATALRFVWILRRPEYPSAFSQTFEQHLKHVSKNLCDYLPDGFRQRTRDRGLIFESWAPQVALLAHPAVGGFLTHGGWNSSLEALRCGVPMAVWPLGAEQNLNAVILERHMCVGLHVRSSHAHADGAVVPAEDVRRAVAELMCADAGSGSGRGAHMRERIRELSAAAASAIVPGGTSYEALASVASTWNSKKPTSQYCHPSANGTAPPVLKY